MLLITLTTVLLTASTGANVIMDKSAPFQCQEAEVAKHCEALIEDDIANLPGFVRLAFHDCVGVNGCNGCLDLKNLDNNGMKVYMDALEAKYDGEKIRETTGISRADFWVLCSHVAISTGQKNSGLTADASGLQLKMKYGRKDCDKTSANHNSTTDAYPSPHGNYNMTTGYFEQEFGLTPNQTIALLGAHTLGRARKDDSGFSNQWVDGEFMFDNVFYKDILDKSLEWVQVDLDGNDNPHDHLQWSQNITNPPKNMMLSADMCLAVDVKPVDGVENRTFEEIGESPGAGLVRIYAKDNKKWLEDFSVAYKKMVEKTTDDIDLSDVQPDGDNSPCKLTDITTAKPSSTSATLPSLVLISILTFVNVIKF